MKKHMAMITAGVLLAGLMLLNTVAFKVSNSERALVKTFGRTTRVIDGRTDAGLKFKLPWPFESLVKYDGRTHVFEDTNIQLATRDNQYLLMTMYCAWRIDDPNMFHRSIVTVEAAEDRIKKLLRDQKGAVAGRHNLSEFVNTEPEQMHLSTIESQIHEPVAVKAMDQYGVEIVSLGIKRLGLTEDTSAAVIENQKKEREAEAQRFRAAGDAQASDIRARAERARKQILAFADSIARSIRAEGEAFAAQQYRFFERDRELATFLRSLESLKKELEGRTTILLEPGTVPAIELFQSGPGGDLSLPTPDGNDEGSGQ